jgi:hypothetical protein
MREIGAPVAVLEKAITAERVVVGSVGGRADRQWDVEDGRLEDTLLGKERDPTVLVVEASKEAPPG